MNHSTTGPDEGILPFLGNGSWPRENIPYLFQCNVFLEWSGVDILFQAQASNKKKILSFISWKSFLWDVSSALKPEITNRGWKVLSILHMLRSTPCGWTSLYKIIVDLAILCGKCEIHPMHFCAILLLEISLGLASLRLSHRVKCRKYSYIYCTAVWFGTKHFFHFFTYSIMFNQWQQNQEVWTCSWVSWQKSCEHCLERDF